jgi:hypothetical protein
MTIAEDRKRYAQAEEQGAAARRAGRPYGANPYRGSTPLVRGLRDAWLQGWQREDMARRASR